MRRQLLIHPIGCSCTKCTPVAASSGRRAIAIKAATRVLFLTAAICAIPFVVAWAIASAQGDRR